MSETHEEERAQPLPYDCPKCKDQGVYLLEGLTFSSGYEYCTCAAGIKAEEEDRGSD